MVSAGPGSVLYGEVGMTDPIDLDERRALRLISKDPEDVEPADIYDFIGKIHSGDIKGVHEICVKCQRNNWKIVHFGKGMLMGSCCTSGCHGATFMNFR